MPPLVSGKGGIDLGEMDSLPPYIKWRISVKGRCGGCNWRDSCRYHAFLEKAQSDKTDFQICNHNYLLADVLHRANSQRPLIPNYQAIVIDEAHKFLQIAWQMYGVFLSSLTLPRLAKTVRSLVFQQGQSSAELWRDTDKLASQTAHLFWVLCANIPDTHEENNEVERFKTEIDGAVLRWLRNLSEVINRLLFRLKSCQPLSQYIVAGLTYPLFLLKRGELNTIERFRQSSNGVLFASGSMWEGIDLPGDILSLLVIVKLPFAVPDPINEHERTLFESAEEYKRAVIVPEMLVKLKQDFGRLIRCESDIGVVALLDSRVREGGSYREQALSALPNCPVTSDTAVVAGFLREKKSSTYFTNL